MTAIVLTVLMKNTPNNYMSEHKHKWFQTTLVNNSKTHKSYACKCGCWKIESDGTGEAKFTNFKVIKKLNNIVGYLLDYPIVFHSINN